MIRARSIATTSTDHSVEALIWPGFALSIAEAPAATVRGPKTPLKARCYAFRACRLGVGNAPTHRPPTAVRVVFGGPLLGDPDRRHRATAELLSGDFPIAARASLAMRSTSRTCWLGQSRCALRA